MTWFERVKACETPVEMAELLDKGGRLFCPCRKCPIIPEEEVSCTGCVLIWLREDAGCKSES